MENTQNIKDANFILDSIVTSLNNSGFLSVSLNQNIYNLFADYFMSKLNINNAQIEYVKLDKGEMAKLSESGNIISISTTMFKQKHHTDLLTSIAHELRHVYQKNNPRRTKMIDLPVPPMYPLRKCTSDCLQEDFRGEVDTLSYYLTSITEKDARDYSHIELQNLLKEIKFHKKASKKTKNWADEQLKNIYKIIQKEEKLYSKALNHVYETFVIFKEIMPKKIDRAIVQMQHNYDALDTVAGNVRAFDKYLYYYSDNTVTQKIIDFAHKTKDIETLIMCINHPNTRITEKNFLDMLSLYSPKTKIKDTNILTQLFSNWKIEEIEKLCSLYNKPFETKSSKRKTNKTKIYENNQKNNENLNKNTKKIEK